MQRDEFSAGLGNEISLGERKAGTHVGRMKH